MSLSVVIGPTGIIAPTYADILASLKAKMRSIYGSDIYLDPDSQDGQMLAIFATAIKDNNDAIIAGRNSFSPATAQGVGLSNVVKINGIRRLVPSNSQVIARIVGVVGTVITQGQIADNAGIRWALPPTVVIPDAGQIDVTATAVDTGATPASPNTLTTIVTPTRGWQTVTNPAAATPGMPVEDDATLRKRQAVSTSIPASTIVGAILGAIKNIIGVGRAYVYENDTDAPDADGLPEHSISAVVEGGDATTIASTIALYKTPGTGTYGDTSETVSNGAGGAITINFFELSLIKISVLVFLSAGTGYVSTTADLIVAAVANWFNNFAIGQDSFLNKLWSPVNLMGDSATNSSGLTQAQLDVLSDTYNATAIYQARQDMDIIGGPYNAGTTVINVTNTNDLSAGNAVALILQDGTFLRTTINGNPAGTEVTLTNAIPAGKVLQNGALIYVADDLTVLFKEAAAADATTTNVQAV